MVTWGVTAAGDCRIGGGGDAVTEATERMAYASASRPALDDDGPASANVESRVQTPSTGSTTRLTIPATTGRLYGEETTRLADHTFPISDGSDRLSCTQPSTQADAGPATVVTQFQGPASLDRQQRQVQLSFDWAPPANGGTTGATTLTVTPAPAGPAVRTQLSADRPPGPSNWSIRPTDTI